ncbi:MAG TPA: hypothetical protein VNX47_04950 [Nevskia sp.]|nr:hypothetical protein [Nevskia sp.]
MTGPAAHDQSSHSRNPGASDMNGTQKLSLSLAAACLLGMGIAGCDQTASPAETQASIAKAEVAGSKSVAESQHAATDSTMDAQKQANKANDELAHQTAEANRRVSVAQAEAGYKVDIEKCKVLSGDALTACNKQADANAAAAKADATASARAADPKP